MADNQSQWPAQYPGYSAPWGYQAPPPSGYQVPPPGYQARVMPSMLASSADRERAVDVLKAGFAEGRLTQDEYNERMGRAYTARTYGDLAALTSDLPAGAMPLPQAWPVPVYQRPVSTNTAAVASAVFGAAEFFTFGLTAIPAVICGHVARRQIRRTGQHGDGLATGGLVLGYLAIVLWALIIVAHVAQAVSVTHGGPVFQVRP